MACRLCLHVFYTDDSEPVADSSWKELLPNILPQVLLELSSDPTICGDCNFKLNEYENFRGICRSAVEKVSFYINSIRDIQNYSSVKLKDVLMFYGEKTEKTHEPICRICFDNCTGELCSLTGNSIYKVFAKSLFLEKIIDNIQNPVLCKKCADKVEEMYLFQQMCLDVENMLQDYAASEILTEEGVVEFAKDIGHILQLDTDLSAEADNLELLANEVANEAVRTEPMDCSDLESATFITAKEVEENQDENCNVLNENTDSSSSDMAKPSTAPVSCPHCGFTVKKKGYLKEHIYVKHTTHHKMFKCPACDFKTVLKRYLRNHIRSQHIETSIVHQCPHCDFQTRQKYALTRHMKSRHKIKSEVALSELRQNTDEDDSGTLEECSFCNYKTKKVDTLKVHIALEHGSPDDQQAHFLQEALDAQCLETIAVSDPTGEVITLECIPVPEPEVVTPPPQEVVEESPEDIIFKMGPPFKCYACGYTTKRRHDMKRHVYNIHSKVWEVVSCEHCDYRTKSKDNLNKHIKSKHLPYDSY